MTAETELACVISSLKPGGAEYTFVDVVQEAVDSGIETAVITLMAPSEGELPLPEGVRRVSLNSSLKEQRGVARVISALGLLWRLRQNLREIRPKKALSFMTQTNVLVGIATVGLRMQRIVCERVHPDYSPFLGTSFLKPLKRWARNIIYAFAEVIVVQSHSMKRCFPSFLQERIRVIPNVVRLFPPQKNRDRKKIVLSVGRLVPQKGYLDGVRAFARAVEGDASWELLIIGSGPEKEALERAGEHLQMEVLPASRELEHYYEEASVFLAPSYYEGFSNVILEAMYFGLPIVATDCPGATSELVIDGQNGVLCPVGSIETIGEALRSLMNDAALRTRMGEEGKEYSQRYKRSQIMPLWRELLLNNESG